jgi:3-oxoacyl-[acyl-carrier protein] reductase
MNDNKVVLVTGSSKGIGRELINYFAKNNYNVVITYLTNKEKALNLKKYVEEQYNIKALCIKLDVTNETEIKNVIKKVINEFGKIDILINNAAYSSDNYIVDKTKDEFMKVLEVNLVGPFLMSKYISEYMNNGTIINISSKDATTTYNEISMDYCASKAGLNSLTKTLSLALKNIKVISVMPGWVNTESVLEMNEDYLNKELSRIGQKNLALKENIAKQIYEIVCNNNIKSGSIIELEDE